MDANPNGNSPAAAEPSVREFLQFTWQHSNFYRELYGAHGIRESDLGHVDLHQLPLVTKQMVRENFDQIVTDPRLSTAAIEAWVDQGQGPRSRFLGEYLIIHSSGSSGLRASMVYAESAWRSLSAAAAVHLFPEPPPGGARYRNAFYTALGERRHSASSTIAMNTSAAVERLIVPITEPIEDTLSRLNAFQPDRLTGYASSLGWLADLALDGRLKIQPRDVVSSADRMTPAIEAKIRQVWNPKIYDLYAASESIAMAVKPPGQAEWNVLDELQMIEVLDAENRQVEAGGMGRVVLTNWTNRALPLIRYDLTDYVICGDTRPGRRTLRGFVGRSYDVLPIRLDDGRSGEIPSYGLADFAIAGLEAFQLVSLSPDEVEVHYRAREDLDGPLHAGIARLLATWGGTRTQFRLRRVDHLWNDYESCKLNLVRKPGEPQIGLTTHALAPPPAPDPAAGLRPGGGFTGFPRERLEESIAAVFERQVARSPDATAVQDGALRLTYAEVNRLANRAAHALLASPMELAQPVLLLFHHQAAMITAMLGVLKAGGCYVPLDPSHPSARNTAILQATGARLVLTDGGSLAAARSFGFTEAQIINLDGLERTVADTNPGLASAADAPACILYTSGTTGQPTGIVLDQRAVLHRAMLYTNDYAIGPADRLALLQSYVFNASVREIYAALLNGAGLHLYSLRREGVHPLAGWLGTEGITVLYMVPATWRVFLDTLQGERFELLRVVRLGGEAVLERDVAGFQRHFGPGCVLANGLASTETGTICQYFMNHQSRVAEIRTPVGFAVQDKEVSLLDDDGRQVADGVIGEMVVASAYMGPGAYAPRSSAAGAPPGEKRVIHTGDLGYRTPDGCLVLVGRKDWQIKLRGQRMNLLEIEHALLTLENVAAAAVVLQTDENGAAFLAAFVQAKAPPAPAPDALRRGLRALLPESMIPAVLLFPDSLPRTAGGKVDRQALPEVKRGADPGAAPATRPLPETPTELALAEIWQDLLGIGQIRVDDGFFDLGGDSLQAAVLMVRIEARFNRRISPGVLIQHGTLRGLAGQLAADDGTGPPGLLVALQPLGDKPPVFLFPGSDGEVLELRELAANLGTSHPLYGLKGGDFGDLAGNPKSIEQTAAQYVVEIQTNCPSGPYLLVGYSFGGHLALETARRLADGGEMPPVVVLIDTYPPGADRSLTLMERFRAHLQTLRRLNTLRDLAGYLHHRRLGISLRLIRHPLTRKVGRQLIAPDSSVVSAALAAYEPTPYPGKVLLFRGDQSDCDPRDDWQRHISGELEIRTVPGDHRSLMAQPHVIELARQLQEVLQASSPVQPVRLPTP